MESLRNNKKEIKEIKNTLKELKNTFDRLSVDWTWLREKNSE